MGDKELLYHCQGASSLALQRQIVSLPIGSFFLMDCVTKQVMDGVTKQVRKQVILLGLFKVLDSGNIQPESILFAFKRN